MIRGLWVWLLVGCRSPHEAPRLPESPRELISAYHLGGLRVEGAPPLDPAIEKALAPFVTQPQARVLDFDGSLLAASRGDCVELPADAIMERLRGRSRPLVETQRGCGSVLWAGYAADHGIAYAIDRDGDEATSLFVTGQAAAISPGRVSDPIWDRSRTRLLFAAANDELWMWQRGAPARRITGGGPWAPLDTSEDGRVVVARRELASSEAALYAIALDTGEAVALTEVGGASATRGRFAPSGDLIAIADGGREHRTLLRISTRWRAWLAEDLDAEVTDFVIVDETIVFVTSTAGVSTLHELELATGHHHPLAGAPTGGVVTDLRTTDAGAVAFSYTSPATPKRIVVVLPQATRGGVDAVVRWPDGPHKARASPSIHDIVASDGVTSSLQAYVPSGSNIPVVLELHGGPEDRWLPRYDGFVQFLVARGHAVIRPNVRGSAGQGRSFLALDDGVRRASVMRDVAAALDWIAAQPNLDRARVFVMGISYGGYLALAALHAFPDRLRGGITLGAITDLVGFLEGTAPYRREHRRAEYGDERDPAVRAQLGALSPITSVGGLARPLLMAYGLRDPRVPAATSEQFVRAARAAGVPVWSMVAADEGHWFERPENRRAFEILTTQFLGH